MHVALSITYITKGWKMHRMVRILLAAVILLALFSVVYADDSITVVDGDEASLRALVSQLAGQPVAQIVGGDEASLRAMTVALAGGGPGWANQKVTVYVAALPKDMPIEFP